MYKSLTGSSVYSLRCGRLSFLSMSEDLKDYCVLTDTKEWTPGDNNK
jgi:hypothetical protein